MRTGRPGAGGFTLIEMLVVLAVIMVLISLLLPGLRGAREAGRTAVCLSNQKQTLRAAISTYANSSKEVHPAARARISLDISGNPITDAVTSNAGRICWPVALTFVPG